MYHFDLNKDKDLCKVARAVIASGVKDQPWEAYRGDKKCLYGKSLQWLADRSLQEEPNLNYRKYVPFTWKPNS